MRRAHRYAVESPRLVEGMTRDEVCEKYRKKVVLLARRVYERLSSDASVQLEDLISCGAIGLLEAFERFDASRGIQFSTYAEYRIRGAMYDALRNDDTFTRRRRQLARKVEQAIDIVRKKVDRDPAPQEVADYLGITLEAYWEALDRVKPISHISLSGVSYGSDEEGRPLIEKLMNTNRVGADTRLMVEEVRRHLREAIMQLPDRQRQCVLMYYGKELSLAEIAAVYGVTVSRVSQILGEARNRLRKKMLPMIDKESFVMETDE